MLEFNDFIYHKDRIPKKDKDTFFKNLEEKFRQEIVNSPEAKAYFKNFKTTDIDIFIKQYAHTKSLLARHYEGYNYLYCEVEEYEYKFHLKAGNALQNLLQKKLFNIQLKWRAGQLYFDSNPGDVNVPGLDVCYDFFFWERHIASCPFVEPITVFEKDILKEYLLTVVDNEIDVTEDLHFGWQEYETLMERDDGGGYPEMPEWYKFYDLKTGTGSLLLLPDLKAEKEDFYSELGYEKPTHAVPPPVEDKDNRPDLFAYGQDIVDFAEAWEPDKYFRQLFRGYIIDYRRNNRPVKPLDLEFTIEELLLADRKITLPTHLPWDEAIMYAYRKYMNTKTAEALDIVYEEYLMRLELGLTATDTTAKLAEDYSDFIPRMKQRILRGRIMNGEPADFNY